MPNGSKFMQERGVPQGLAISPILFVIYLDQLLKENGLLAFQLLAYADDLVFFARSKTEVCDIINKLRKLTPFLYLNEEKSGLMQIGS
jgi:RNA-directed DNA polymerase